jgi:SpoVK/Ycf46/Vps4 family AAA+-type ATPase
MDAMLQRRVDDEGKPQLTVQQQFMTTSMLPHLAELYDAQRVLFFFATNYKETFDLAITRAGRFDMLLFVGPPSWKEKARQISKFAKLQDNAKAPAVGTQLLKWIPDTDPLNEALTRATFSEARGMFREVCQGKQIDVAIDDKSLDAAKLRACVEQWKEKEFSLCVDPVLSKQYKDEQPLSEVRW